MDKRVIVTIVVSLIAMWGWLYVSSKLWPPAPPPKPPATQTAPATQPAAAGRPRPTTQPGAATQPGAPRPPEELVDIPLGPTAGARFHATLSTYGGALRHFVLTNPQYREEVKGKLVQIDLVRGARGWDLPLKTTFHGKVVDVPDDAVYRVVSKGPHEVVFVYDGPTAEVTKRYRYDAQKFLFDLDITVVNKTGARDDDLRATVFLYGWQNPAHKGGGFLRPPSNVVSGACYVGGSLKREGHEKLVKEPIEEHGDVRWVGIDEKYFLLAAVPTPDQRERGCAARGQPNDRFVAELRYAPRTLTAGQRESYPVQVFAGPKVVKVLDAVTAGGKDAHLGEAVNFGWFAFIARPLLWILKLFQRGVHNWGLAIILLTVFVKLITLYWTQKSMRSMKEMAKLKPKITALQEKYKGDKNRLNQEMMALYKAHGVNPLSGCLPMLLQMPIWFALYSTLQVSVELYRTPFALWITDLTAPDKYYVMPVLTGVLMFVQQKISPTPQDTQQAKLMLYMMPVMFTGFMLFVPSGLTLYILTNTVLSMGHQYWLNRQDRESVPPVAAQQEAKQPAGRTRKRPKA